MRDLKGENDRLKAELADLRKSAQDALQDQVSGLPKPLSEQQTTAIAQAEGNRVLEEAKNRNKKFSLLGLNVGPTFGDGRTGDFTFSGTRPVLLAVRRQTARTPCRRRASTCTTPAARKASSTSVW